MNKHEIQDRESVAVDAGLDAFWSAVADQFPEIKTGDFPPDADVAFWNAARDAVKTWVELNGPNPIRFVKQGVIVDGWHNKQNVIHATDAFPTNAEIIDRNKYFHTVCGWVPGADCHFTNEPPTCPECREIVERFPVRVNERKNRNE